MAKPKIDYTEAHKNGLPTYVVLHRIRRGWSTEKATTTPLIDQAFTYIIKKNDKMIYSIEGLSKVAEKINQDCYPYGDVTKNKLIGQFYRKGCATITIRGNVYTITKKSEK